MTVFRQRRWRRAILVAGGLLALYAVALLVFRSNAELTAARCDASIRDGLDYLMRHLDTNGRFEYIVHVDGTPAGRDYNVVRHGGALYALGLADQRGPDAHLRGTIQRSAQFLVRQYVRPVTGKPGMSAVFSLPGEEVPGLKRFAKLGASGLGLVALAKAYEADPATVSLQVLRELGNFVLFMQQPNGRFESVYDETVPGYGTFQSLYYPGEAILGLACLHRVDPDPRWLKAAAQGLLYLEESRRDLPFWRLPDDHWYMIATAALLPRADQALLPPAARARLVNHTRAIARRMRSEQWLVSRIPGLDGSFAIAGAIPSSATRLEGLIAFASMLPENHPEREPLERAIRRGLVFLLRAQVTEGAARGGFTGAVRSPLPFQTRMANEIRIDYVQHTLCALMQYRQLAENSR